MKDMPVFATENGVASLTLREIPYTARAYIHIRSSLGPMLLLNECVDFCRAVGAQEIFAAGDDVVESYPFHTTVLRMTCRKEALGDTEAALWPVQEDTISQWKEIYNQKAVKVPNAAWMTDADCGEMLQAGDGYFIHSNGCLLGIGRASGNEIRWVAAIAPGAGADVVRALARTVAGDMISLEVASTNNKAVDLYTKLGFLTVGERSRWHRIC